jgi:serine/threonine protein kinase
MAGAKPRLGTGELSPNKVVAARYQIVNRIAQGGMGAVYLVKDLRLSDVNLGRDRFCALKEMSESAFTADQLPEAMRMFEMEAKMLAGLRHPNLPEVTDCFEFESKQYLVMDYIRGKTLEEILKRSGGPLPFADVFKWSNQLFGVFQYLHDQNPPIIYRDVKPSNIMLEEGTGLVKIIDFGIARFLRRRTSRNLMPAGGALEDVGIGTPGYAAPEQWKKGEPHPQSDIYSLGVVLHQLLTNNDPTLVPFSLPPIASLNRAVPVRIAGAIAKAYALPVSERYQTMRDFQNALQQAWLDSYGGWNAPSHPA